MGRFDLGKSPLSEDEIELGLCARKITVVGDFTYTAVAVPGTPEATAAWSCKCSEVDGDNTIITWADGNASFDNIATDLTALVYA